MGFKEIADLSADTTVSLGGFNKAARKDNPTKVEGYYLGSRQTPNKKTGGMSTIYFIQTPKGNMGVWGKTDMDKKMTSVPVGAMVRIQFDKMIPTPKGDMYSYKVAVDLENTIDLGGIPNSSKPEFNADEEIPEAFEAADSSDTSADDEDAAQAAQLAAAERAAKVKALLSGNKTKKN